MFTYLKYFAITAILATVPSVALADHASTSGRGLGGVIQTLNGLLNAIIPFIITLAVVYFLWGVSQYILKSGDEAAHSQAIKTMTYGIIALFVMVSVWGLVALLTNTFGLGNTVAPRAPGLPV